MTKQTSFRQFSWDQFHYCEYRHFARLSCIPKWRSKLQNGSSWERKNNNLQISESASETVHQNLRTLNVFSIDLNVTKAIKSVIGSTNFTFLHYSLLWTGVLGQSCMFPPLPFVLTNEKISQIRWAESGVGSRVRSRTASPAYHRSAF